VCHSVAAHSHNEVAVRHAAHPSTHPSTHQHWSAATKHAPSLEEGKVTCHRTCNLLLLGTGGMSLSWDQRAKASRM
jgi:hypothetical protein